MLLCSPLVALFFWFQKIPSKSRAKIDENGAAAAVNNWLLEPSSLDNLQDIYALIKHKINSTPASKQESEYFNRVWGVFWRAAP